jgi:hypothetical protein
MRAVQSKTSSSFRSGKPSAVSASFAYLGGRPVLPSRLHLSADRRVLVSPIARGGLQGGGPGGGAARLRGGRFLLPVPAAALEHEARVVQVEPHGSKAQACIRLLRRLLEGAELVGRIWLPPPVPPVIATHDYMHVLEDITFRICSLMQIVLLKG